MNETPEIQPEHPGIALRRMLDERGWTVTDLAAITGFARSALSSILTGRTGISPDMAIGLGAAFQNDPAEWLQLHAQHQLSLVEVDADAVSRRARLFSEVPIHDMQKRGWLPGTTDIDRLEKSLKDFRTGVFKVATLRRSSEADLTPAEKAWCHQARRLARDLPFVAEFDPSRLGAAEKKLRQLAAYEKEAERVAEMLSYYGIRFVVVEPLPGAEIDGAAFWLNETAPVIAISLRWDRIDAFWFTVFHEFMHIKHGDVMSVDVALVQDGERGMTVAVGTDEAERRANNDAAAALVPPAAIESFIATTSPRYSSDAIVQFAHQIKMHPGVIVGQLQHRGELNYSAHRAFLVKVRKSVTESAVTDGWGHAPLPVRE